MAEKAAVEEDEEQQRYSLLKDLNLEIKYKDVPFSLCFWIYLPKSIPFPCTILTQVYPGNAIPFLLLDKAKKMKLFPLRFLHKEASAASLISALSCTEVPCAASTIHFPPMKWVHIGCQIDLNIMKLYINGELVGEKKLTCLSEKKSVYDDLKKVTLVNNDGKYAGGINGYVYNVNVYPPTLSIKDYYLKNPPMQLSVDSSSVSGIEADNIDAWTIVGGKASCRKDFSLDVIIVDGFGKPMHRDMEIVASLVYADNEALVEKSEDGESPLLTSCDGTEFASCDRPSTIVKGRATFKLKISQLSSKCDNRLFCIKFHVQKQRKYPFFEALSHPIRCVSSNSGIARNNAPSPSPSPSPSSFAWKKIPSGVHVLNGSQSSQSKRVKLGNENPFPSCKDDNMSDQANGGCCNSFPGTTNEDKNNHEESEDSSSSSDSESSEGTDSISKSVPNIGVQLSDLAVFKYCLGGITDRSQLLKGIIASVSQNELEDFAQQVSLYSGCSHHRQQIIICKRLIEDGIRTWNLVSQDKDHLRWEKLVNEIKLYFCRISRCTTRFLEHQDWELLRKIGGCQDIVSRDCFEKIWCWLYPVGVTLSKDWINAAWSSISPKWIEGFITKEEAESSLSGTAGGPVQVPGTFILRFPTSRIWPHPDAGNLIITYVGTDYRIHHRLLNEHFVYSSNVSENGIKSLQDMLLEEPELSRLGRVIRSSQHAG